MTILITKSNKHNSILSKIKNASDVNISICLQCKKCSSGCPVSSVSEFIPSEIIRRLQLGYVDHLLDKDAIWMCLSCETCYTRCPMGIDIAAVIDELKIAYLKQNKNAKNQNMILFNNSFLKAVKMFGRAYEFGILATYKFKTLSAKKDSSGRRSFFKDADKFFKLFKKHKIAIFPKTGANRSIIHKIFSKIKNL